MDEKKKKDRKETKAAAGGAAPSLLSAEDLHLFNEGTHTRLYEKLGAHVVPGGAHFAVWAPDAEAVSVVGDFNGWNAQSHPLRPRESSGIWEGFLPGVARGACYKYFVASRYNLYRAQKADPFAVRAQTPPETASVVWDRNYAWGDGDWMSHRRRRHALDAPISVYEVHLGSWMRVPEEAGYRCDTQGRNVIDDRMGTGFHQCLAHLIRPAPVHADNQTKVTALSGFHIRDCTANNNNVVRRNMHA